MPTGRCSQCGKEEFLPFRCKLCGQPHCLDHRLPENHACPGLDDYRARRAEERVVVVPREEGRPEGVRVRVGGGGQVRAAAFRVRGWTRRSMTHRLLALVLAVYALQWAGGLAYGAASGIGALEGVQRLTCGLALGSCDGEPFGVAALVAKPWSPVTSIFTHSPNPLHILFNAIFLYFFGLALEARVGPRKMLGVFLVAGVVAGLAQATLFPGAVLGASGGLMGVLGVLTILAPTMQVLFYFVPVPLWVMTIFFVVLDVAGVFGGETAGVANLAHLTGLAVGLAYGYQLRRRGVLPRMTNPWAFSRRQ